MKIRFRLVIILGLAIGLFTLGTWIAILQADDLKATPVVPRSEAVEELAEVSGGEATAPATSEPLPEKVNVWEEAALREILEIRSQQGDLFEGTVFDEMADRQGDTQPGSTAVHWTDGEFLRALRDVARKHTVTWSPHEVSRIPHAGGAAYFRPLAGKAGAASVDEELVSALRHACRQLDRKANDLEDDRQYERADELRRLSRKLRTQARRTSGGAGGSQLRPAVEIDPPAAK